jgi:hypothetical protein|tara:strand:- start:160 stop:345 length:186 start_codon:yes stop_codon:yes gene_type:complete
MVMSWLDEICLPVLQEASVKKVVVNAVIEEMKIDIQNGDWSAIEELLHKLSEESLINYLPK